MYGSQRMSGQTPAGPQFVQKFDNVPDFWQYLQGLASADLVTELLQNELDAGSTRTRIVFATDRLVCEGNGEPVDADGWKRLSFLRGAGDLAPRKMNQLGVKNHGLKACFTIGDEIVVRSAGQQIRQSLYKNGFSAPPAPGAYEHPIRDAEAPLKGCRVEVPYRSKTLRPQTGEVFDFRSITPVFIEEIFGSACKAAPGAFIGALVPGVRDTFILEIVHEQLGTVIFEYQSHRPAGRAPWRTYRRLCKASSGIVGSPSGVLIEERCHRFVAKVPRAVAREIPEFFATPGGFYIELAWRINTRGIPASTTGRRRYPITYVQGGDTTLTGLGVHVSAPYVSDTERHGVARDNDFNIYVDKSAEHRLVRLLRARVLREHGAAALSLLYDPANISPCGEESDKDSLIRLVNELIAIRGLPLWRSQRRGRRSSGSGKGVARKVTSFGPRRRRNSEDRRVLLPVFTWENRFSRDLAALSPTAEDLIHPLVPQPIFERLAMQACNGWESAYVTFDENDVALRWINDEDAYFPWDSIARWKAEFADPRMTSRYMDALVKMLENDVVSGNVDAGGLQEKALVTDVNCVPRHMSDVFAAKNLPRGLPGAEEIWLLHSDLVGHRLWRKKDWKRPRLTFDAFLALVGIATAGRRHQTSVLELGGEESPQGPNQRLD